MIRGRAPAFLFASCFASNAASSSDQTQAVIAEAFTSSGCPVVVRAQYSPGGHLIPVEPAAQDKRREPLRLYFSPDSKRRIVHAQISIRGISTEGGILPASTDQTSPWIVKTFDANVTEDSKGNGTATV